MSKPRKPQPKPFRYETNPALKPLKKYATQWNLRALYYKSERDPKLQADIEATERAYKAFAKKWRKRDFTASANTLVTALKEYEELSSRPEAARPGRYLNFRTVLDVNDTKAEKLLGQLSQRFRALRNETVFFSLRIGQIPKTKQAEYLHNPKLEPYRYYLERAFIEAAHQLSESEEKICILKSRQSYGAWVDMTDKILSNRLITFKGATIALPEALERLNTLSRSDRRALWKVIMKECEQIGEVAEHEFNAIITDVRTEEELRGYKKPYSSTALSYQDSETGIENLVQVISTEGFRLSKRFHADKAKYFKVPKLEYADRYETIGAPMHIPFAQAVEICRDVFYGVDNRYGSIFDTMLSKGQIDVYPKKGKRGGAFMSEQVNQPTQVLLNHTDDLTSLRTLAHEMGHAIHAERSKGQPARYQGHSITTAETASTLFENLLFDKVYAAANDKDKPALLHDRIAQNIATIQRQIACFNCELEIHQTVMKEGAMNNAELRDAMVRHLKSYLGPAVSITPSDGYTYVYWSHLRYGFYVYTYTFGLLMSTIMANRFKADASYRKEIDIFLTAGESDTVANIFKKIDIDVTKPDTFSEALKNHAAHIAEFSAVVKATK